MKRSVIQYISCEQTMINDMKTDDVVEIVTELTQNHLTQIECFAKEVMQQTSDYCDKHGISEDMKHMILCYASQIAIDDVEFTFSIQLLDQKKAILVDIDLSEVK